MRSIPTIAIAAMSLAGCKPSTRHDDAERTQNHESAPRPTATKDTVCPPHQPRAPGSLKTLEEELGQTAMLSIHLDGSKLSPNEREALLIRKEALDTARRAWENARDGVAIACLEFAKARIRLRGELLEAAARNPDASDAMQRVETTVRCWPYTAQPAERLRELADGLGRLESAVSSSTSEVASFTKSLREQYAAILDARGLLQPVYAKYVTAADELAKALGAGAKRLGAKSADVAAFALITSRIPRMHAVSANIDLLVSELGGAKPLGGGPMCENVTAPEDLLDRIVTDKAAALELQERWEQRREATAKAIEEIFHVAGTEL